MPEHCSEVQVLNTLGFFPEGLKKDASSTHSARQVGDTHFKAQFPPVEELLVSQPKRDRTPIKRPLKHTVSSTVLGIRHTRWLGRAGGWMSGLAFWGRLPLEDVTF